MMIMARLEARSRGWRDKGRGERVRKTRGRVMRFDFFGLEECQRTHQRSKRKQIITNTTLYFLVFVCAVEDSNWILDDRERRLG